MKFQKFDYKFKGMRKVQDWIVYPHTTTDEHWIIQSDTRIAKVEKNGKMILSKSHPNGSYYVHLSEMLGAESFDVPSDLMNILVELQATGKEFKVVG